MTQPITPKEVKRTKLGSIPPEVIEAFNELIQENFDGDSATVKQNKVVTRICEKLKVKRETVFEKGWLDIEELFQKAGWRVMFDKPAYNETYDAFFEFEIYERRRPPDAL
jgi:hypothetical protein